jgi:hypothetical protein
MLDRSMSASRCDGQTWIDGQGMAMARTRHHARAVDIYIWQLVRRSARPYVSYRTRLLPSTHTPIHSISISIYPYRADTARVSSVGLFRLPILPLPRCPTVAAASLARQPARHRARETTCHTSRRLAALRCAPYVLRSSLSITSPAPACLRLHQTLPQAPCHARSPGILPKLHHQSSPWPPQLTPRRLSTLPVDAKAALKALLSALLHPRATPPSNHKPQDIFSQFTVTDEFDSDDILFPDDANSSGVVLFPDATSTTYSHSSCVPNNIMPSPPIQIATPRQPSNSPPRNQHSNLTSQLRQPQATDDLEMDGIPNNNDLKPRQESVSMLSTTPYGARAIPVTDGMGFRRESHVGLSGSLMGGMSWGGLSMGSFVRDE